MKVIQYHLCTMVNLGTETAPDWQESLFPVTMVWNSDNEELAKREAHNGHYEIVEQQAAPDPSPTRLDTIEAQLAYTAMMTDTLLEV